MIKNIIYLTMLVLLIGLTFSAPDSNGVWHRIEDVRTGTFAADENVAGFGSFTFIHPVYFMDPLVGIGTSSPLAELHVAGDIIADNLDLNNDLNVSGDTNISGSLNVTGNITSNILYAADVILPGGNLDDLYVNEGQLNSITSNMVVDNSLTANDLAANSVGSSEIANNAVGSSEIANNAVGSSEIANNAVGSSEIANNAVGSSEIASNAVGSSEIANNAVGSSEIANGAIQLHDVDLPDFDARYLNNEIDFLSTYSISTFSRSANDDTDTKNMGNKDLCMLTRVHSGGVNSGCKLYVSGGNWYLKTYDEDSADTQHCNAICFN